jgi:hypothetical protein
VVERGKAWRREERWRMRREEGGGRRGEQRTERVWAREELGDGSHRLAEG